jgi:predicted TIM-barrel fold metal-dependent hydrolase
MARIIDGDGHIVEPPDLWLQYTASSYHDRVPQIVMTAEGMACMQLEGAVRSGAVRSAYASCVPAGLMEADRSKQVHFDDVPHGGYDPHARVAVLDQEGIEAAFLYPSIGLGLGHLTDLDLAAVCARAYNDWLADFCQPYPNRLFGVGMMPLQDVDASVYEMRRVVRDKGMKAVFIRPNPYNNRRLNDPAYDSFWQTAQELDCAVAIHGSFNSRMPTVGSDRYPDEFFQHMICHPFEQQMACMDLVCGGVLAKYPRLRVAFMEAGVGWLGYWLERMDGHYESMPMYVPWLQRKPSEYFLSQCFLSCDPDDATISSMMEFGGDTTIIWGSDYPHFDCTFPDAVGELVENCSRLTDAQRTAVVGENAARLYHI